MWRWFEVECSCGLRGNLQTLLATATENTRGVDIYTGYAGLRPLEWTNFASRVNVRMVESLTLVNVGETKSRHPLFFLSYPFPEASN